MTDREDFDWCVSRAMDYIGIGDAQNAFNSFISDTRKVGYKIDEASLGIGMFEILRGPQAVKKWIEGFPPPKGEANNADQR